MNTIIYDANNYKKCRKKQYDIYVCMPPKGTIVINKLEQADSVQMTGGKTWFTPDMYENNPQIKGVLQMLLASNKAYLVSQEQPFVLAGTLGELWTIKADKLAKKYYFLSGNDVEEINQNSLDKRAKDGMLDWTCVRTRPDNSTAFACFVPINIKGEIQTSWKTILNYNGVGVSHGKGDFIIAADNNGQPNLQDIYVVNGAVFATTYNNHGWGDCIDKRVLNRKPITKDMLPKFMKVANTVAESDSPEDNKLRQYFQAICSNLNNIFLCEGFNSEMTPEFENDRCRIQVAEKTVTNQAFMNNKSNKSEATYKSSTLFISYDAKTKKVNIKGKREGKVLDTKYRLRPDDIHTTLVYVGMYLEVCELFKMTPYRYICSSYFLSLASKSYNDFIGKSGRVLKPNFKSVVPEYNKNAISSLKFQVGIFESEAVNMVDLSESKHGRLEHTYNIELNIRINRGGIKELLSEIKKGDTDISKVSELIKNVFKCGLRVAYVTVPLELPPLAYYPSELFRRISYGVKEEQNRQRSSNAQTKIKKSNA